MGADPRATSAPTSPAHADVPVDFPVIDAARQAARALRRARSEAGLTQRQLARLLDVADATIGHWESGRRNLSLNDVYRIAYVLGVAPSALLPPTTGAASGLHDHEQLLVGLGFEDLAHRLPGFIANARPLRRTTRPFVAHARDPRDLAHEVLAHHRSKIPVPVDAIAEAFGCRMTTWSAGANLDIRGLVIPTDQEPILATNRRLSRVETRLTLARCFAHTLLRPEALYLDLGPASGGKQLPQTDAAHNTHISDLAASILMPADKLRAARTQPIIELADSYAVPTLAMSLRLLELGLTPNTTAPRH